MPDTCSARRPRTRVDTAMEVDRAPELGGLVLESELDDLRAKGCEVTSTRIEGVGHSVHTDAVDRFVSDLGRFLKSSR